MTDVVDLGQAFTEAVFQVEELVSRLEDEAESCLPRVAQLLQESGLRLGGELGDAAHQATAQFLTSPEEAYVSFPDADGGDTRRHAPASPSGSDGYVPFVPAPSSPMM